MICIEEEEDVDRESRHRSSSPLSSLEYLCQMSSDVDINMDGFCPYILLLNQLLEFLRLIA